MKCRLKEMEEEAAAFHDTQANVTKEMQGSLPMCLPIFSFLHESIGRCTEPCRAPVIAGWELLWIGTSMNEAAASVDATGFVDVA